MILLAVVVASVGIVTNLITQQVRGQDPLYQCIESDEQPYQAYVTMAVTVDGQQLTIPENIGISPDCMRPIHTHDNSGLIHLAYEKPHEFRLGHFFWYWGFDIMRYDARVYVNGIDPGEEYLDTVLKDGMSTTIDFTSKRNTGII